MSAKWSHASLTVREPKDPSTPPVEGGAKQSALAPGEKFFGLSIECPMQPGAHTLVPLSAVALSGCERCVMAESREQTSSVGKRPHIALRAHDTTAAAKCNTAAAFVHRRYHTPLRHAAPAAEGATKLCLVATNIQTAR